SKDSLPEREKPLVSGQREKFFELFGARQLFEQEARVAEAARARALLARDPDEHGPLLPDERLDARLGDDFARLELRAMTEPLPELRARNLGRRRILHQMEERNAALAAKPSFEVEDAVADVVAKDALGP